MATSSLGAGLDSLRALEGSLRLAPAPRQESFRASGSWPAETMLDRLLTRAVEDPHRAAIITYRQGEPTPTTMTYGQLAARSERMAARLIDLGVAQGDVVSIQLPNSWEFTVAAVAAARVGAIINPLVHIFRRRELNFMLKRAGTKVLFVPTTFRGHDHQQMAIDLLPDVPSLEAIAVVGDEVRSDHPSVLDVRADLLEYDRNALAAVRATLDERRPTGTDVASLMYTSGTTGEPKGTLHTHDTLWSAGRGVFETLTLDSRDVTFMASPMGHLTGYLWGMLFPLSLGMTNVFQEVWDADRFLDIVEDEGVTWTVSATPFAVDMIAAQKRRPRDVSSFTQFVCAGAPIPPTLFREAEEVLGVRLLAQWGTSECGGVTIQRPSEVGEGTEANDGRCVDFMECVVLDGDRQPTPVGVEGRLYARGPSVFVGYLGRPDLYDEVVDGEGWFDTGDLGVRLDDGSVRITGRAKDIIVRGGENVPVAEVENVLITHEYVQEVAVVGLPDERLGERGCAIIVPHDQAPTLADLTAHLDAEGMAKQYWPEHLVVIPEMPRTPSGKIQKFLLRKQLLDQARSPQDD